MEPIVASISSIIIIFFAFQTALYTLILSAVGGNPMTTLPAFITVTLAVHVILLTFLVKMKESFVVEPSGRKLGRMNAANTLTVARISSTPTLMFLLVNSKSLPLIPILIILTFFIFITDLFDGFISRRMGEVTKMGRMLDSISDYTILFHVAIGLLWLELLPIWYFVLLLARLFFQALGQLAFLMTRGKVEARASFLGKATIASTMLLFGCELVRAAWTDAPAPLYFWLEALAGFIIAISILDKAFLFYRQAKTKERK